MDNLKKDLKSLTYSELSSFIEELGEPKYKAKQIFSWLSKGISSFNEMTDISKSLREKLDKKSFISAPVIIKTLNSEDGSAKFLLELSDKNIIECVVMKYIHGNSICISTQVGCEMGCAFCASTIGGKKRNLTAGEMLDEYIFVQKAYGEKLSTIVMMGIGEPLDNYENVLTFLENINNPYGVNLSHRHISLSTCGLVDKIYSLAEKCYGLTLSVSLHAPNDKIRNEIMPISKKWSIEELLKACRYYANKTGRRISFEYTMIDGLNDTPECARELSQRLKKINCHINLIPVNKNDRNKYEKSSDLNIKKFSLILTKAGYNVTVRRVLGKDINASCGQLRKTTLSERGDKID